MGDGKGTVSFKWRIPLHSFAQAHIVLIGFFPIGFIAIKN